EGRLENDRLLSQRAVSGRLQLGPLGSELRGSDYVGSIYRHPWMARRGQIAGADFVAMDTGTGLVHIAPGHGEEDSELGRALGLKIYNPVDADGRFVADVAHVAA